MYLKGVGGGSAQVALMGGETHPSCSMIRVEDPGSSFMLYLGPGPSSLLCLTRANKS
jgi:hypothetical protein